MRRKRRHSNTHGTQGGKSGSRQRKLKRLADTLRVPYGKRKS